MLVLSFICAGVFNEPLGNEEKLFVYREEKEKWIRSKYELKEFVPSPPYLDVPLPQVVYLLILLLLVYEYM